MLTLGADFVQVPAADIGEHPDQQDEEEDEKDDETDRADAAAEGASPGSPQQAGEEGLDLWQAVHPFSPSRSGDLALSAVSRHDIALASGLHSSQDARDTVAAGGARRGDQRRRGGQLVAGLPVR